MSATATPLRAPATPVATSFAQMKSLLWQDAGTRVHAVVDAARVPGLVARLAAEDVAGWDCLQRGALTPAAAECAAYVVELRRASPFTDWLLFEATFALPGWGVVAASRRALLDIREHFRSLARVRLPDGSEREWRWFDPTVLDAFLGLATAEQQGALIGPLQLLVTPLPEQWNCYAFDGAALTTAPRRLLRERG